MDMKTIRKQIDDLIKKRHDRDLMKQASAKLYNECAAIEEALCNYAEKEGLKGFDFDDIDVKISRDAKIEILGGETKAPWKKTDVVKYLINSGFLDDDKAKFFEGVAINTNTLNAALKKLAPNFKLDLEKEGLISLSAMPSVKIEVKK